MIQMISRNWPLMMISAILLAGGLFALSLPVSLGGYDEYGIQINCGNAYQSQLLQATIDDERSAARAAPTNYVDRCESAVARRRGWAIPIAALGVLILVPEIAKWARSRPAGPDSADGWHERPDQYIREAATLDRRGLPYRERPPGTTL